MRRPRGDDVLLLPGLLLLDDVDRRRRVPHAAPGQHAAPTDGRRAVEEVLRLLARLVGRAARPRRRRRRHRRQPVFRARVLAAALWRVRDESSRRFRLSKNLIFNEIDMQRDLKDLHITETAWNHVCRAVLVREEACPARLLRRTLRRHHVHQRVPVPFERMCGLRYDEGNE